MVTASQRREAVGVLKALQVSERRSCQLVGISRHGVRYESRRSDGALLEKLKAIADEQAARDLLVRRTELRYSLADQFSQLGRQRCVIRKPLQCALKSIEAKRESALGPHLSIEREGAVAIDRQPQPCAGDLPQFERPSRVSPAGQVLKRSAPGRWAGESERQIEPLDRLLECGSERVADQRQTLYGEPQMRRLRFEVPGVLGRHVKRAIHRPDHNCAVTDAADVNRLGSQRCAAQCLLGDMHATMKDWDFDRDLIASAGTAFKSSRGLILETIAPPDGAVCAQRWSLTASLAVHHRQHGLRDPDVETERKSADFGSGIGEYEPVRDGSAVPTPDHGLGLARFDEPQHGHGKAKREGDQSACDGDSAHLRISAARQVRLGGAD